MSKRSEPKGEVVLAVKGFDSNMQCRGFQYEFGQTYTHDGEVTACQSGFHACENPLDVFGYYAPGDSRFATVEMSGEFSRDGGDSKIAAGSITVKGEIKIPALVEMGVNWILSKIDNTKKETNTGNRSAATNTGDRSAATNTGNRSAATNTGNRSAATNTGDWSAATNTGDRSAAEVEGKGSVAIATGYQSKARASESGAIVLCHRDDDFNLIHIRASKVGENGIKAGVWYVLDSDGEFQEAQS